MTIRVTIDIHSEDGDLNAHEKAVLAALGGTVHPTAPGSIWFNPESGTGISTEPGQSLYLKTDGTPGEQTPEPEAEKPAEAPKRTRRSKAQIAADEAAKKAAEAEAEEAAGEEDAPKAEEDPAEATAPSSENEDVAPPAEETSTEPAGDEPAATPDAPTVEEVVTRASVLMKAGKQPEVRALLDRVGNGAERISQLAAKDIPAFWAGLDELENPSNSDIL